MTPAAAALIAELDAEARVYDDITTADGSTIARQRAEAKRDTLTGLVRRLPRVLAAVEAEAVEEAMQVTAWLEEGAGVPA